MTLATHIVVAGAVVHTVGIQSPWWAIPIAIATHYAADAIPHHDYAPEMITQDPKNLMDIRVSFAPHLILKDTVKIGTDAAVGLGSLFLFWNTGPETARTPLLLSAALGGILPDALQMIYGIWKKPLAWIQRIHDFFHHPDRTRELTHNEIISQGAVFLAALALLRF